MNHTDTPQLDRALPGGLRLVQFDGDPAVVTDSGGNQWNAAQLRARAQQYLDAATALEAVTSLGYAQGHASGLVNGYQAARWAADNCDLPDDPQLPGVIPGNVPPEQRQGWTDGYLAGVQRFEDDQHPPAG